MTWVMVAEHPPSGRARQLHGRALMRDSRGRPETPLGVALAHIVETEEERR